jgi:penicillin amidase
MIRRVWFLMLACVVGLMLVGVLGLAHLRVRAAESRLPERGSYVDTVPGCPARVEILFDGRGIPHVKSDSEAALWFSQGYLHARDRFFQMEMARRLAAGRQAEVFGEVALDSDRKMRILRIAASARRQAAMLTAGERRELEAYAAGVNSAISRFGKWIAPEIWLLGVEPQPWRIEDSLGVGLLMQLDLSWAMGEELQRAMELAHLGRDRAVELWGWSPSQARAWIPPGDGVKHPFRDHEPITAPMGGVGSNCWALGPERCVSGRPLLANDAHLGVRMPGTFYAIHLNGPQSHVAGASIAGFPGVIIGHTEGVAWGLTLSMLDDQDLFLLSLDDSGGRELVNGRWQPLRTVIENIEVRWQPDPVLVKIRLSVHGPLVREQRDEAIALAWAGLHGPSFLPAILKTDRANTVEEAAAAWEHVISPSMNLLAADTDGHILHQVVGRAPKRARGAGRLPAPGGDSRWGWAGFRPMSANPRRLDPKDGFLASANHDVFGEGNYPERDRFPADFAPPWRYRRIRSALIARTDWTIDSCVDLQGDVVSGRAIAVLKQLRADLEALGGPTAEELMAWDARMTVDSYAALLFSRLMIELGQAIGSDEAARDGLSQTPIGPEEVLLLLAGGLHERWWDDVRTAEEESQRVILNRVLERLDELDHGENWGDVHQVVFEHPMAWIPRVGRLVGRSWNRGPFPAAGDNVTVNATYWSGKSPFAVTTIPALRFIADVGNWDETVLVLPMGESGRPWSSHYSDQIQTWLQVGERRFPFSDEAVEAAAVARLELVPEAAGNMPSGESR